MPDPGNHTPQDKIDFTQIISLVLSLYILAALIVQTLCPLPSPTNDLLDKIDSIICVFFLYDFSIRLHRAESKWAFMKWGWIDLISSIPLLGFFQWARIVRVARLIRVLRALRSTKILVHYVFRHRARGTLATALLVSFLMMIFSSIAILNFENAPQSNIKTPEDALWWAFTTMTTVGYGDRYPVTTGGRIVAACLMVSSVGLFSVFTAYIASLFVSEDKKKDDASHILALIEEVRLLRLKLEAGTLNPKDTKLETGNSETER